MKAEWKKQIAATIRAHKETVARFEVEGLAAIEAAAQAIIKALKQNRRLYICGNGGSAADAQHIASELVGRFERHRTALPAVALTTDTSALTSVANDYGYHCTFSRQVEALVRKGDILWAISTSGTSENIIEAVAAAKKKGAHVLAFTGKSRSKLERMADICFCTHCESTARSQEIHQLAYHIICDLVEQAFCRK
ncbi:MAG: D-sedoheptulose-7-phosphate isomerase [Planctomycetota bacterium]|jgi:D-sedoheptulose 7-phosphate isomerase